MRVQLTPAHAELLEGACSCLPHLCGRPGKTALDSDFHTLKQFCAEVLALATSPSLESTPALPMQMPALQTLPVGKAPEGDSKERSQGSSAAPGSAFDLQQTSAQLAVAVLGALRQSPVAGMVLLSCTAPDTRDCLAALVAAITGEQVLAAPAAAACWPAAVGSEAPLTPGVGGAADEACLLHAFASLSEQLSAGLQLLPQWVQTVKHPDAFMQASWLLVVKSHVP
jgi:hypothetical protein